MTTTAKVLDHGFVTLRNISGPTRRIWYPAAPDAEQTGVWDVVCGAPDRKEYKLLHAFDASDTDVANSARMSFEGTDQERSYEIEMKLNRYLMANKHMTPFESIEVWLEMKLPIFVARQFVRHRTAALNEVSGRYVTLPAEWYIPEVVGGKAKDKKQGQEDNLPENIQALFRDELDSTCQAAYQKYLWYIEHGVAAEHARLFLHVNHYTHWLWKQDLRNLMGFLSLRQHGHAQVEARAYANAIVELLEPQIPGLIGLYNELVRS
jgi:thymidylate synthase (FAD)